MASPSSWSIRSRVTGHPSGPLLEPRGPTRRMPEVGEIPTRSRHCNEHCSSQTRQAPRRSRGTHDPEGVAADMAAVAIPRTVPEPIRIPVRELVPWAIFAGVFLLFLLYVVGAEQGAV